jgi:hypothetical protein
MKSTQFLSTWLQASFTSIQKVVVIEILNQKIFYADLRICTFFLISEQPSITRNRIKSIYELIAKLLELVQFLICHLKLSICPNDKEVLMGNSLEQILETLFGNLTSMMVKKQTVGV